MPLTIVNPKDWAKPVGYNNGMKAKAGNFVFIAGQIAWDKDKQLVGRDDFVKQFDQALANVLAVVTAAGGQAHNLAKLTIYVTNKDEYLTRLKETGQAYRHHLGIHFPAMTLVEVKSLVEKDAKVEIDGVAVI